MIIFLDSDVIISSLISQKGAAYFLVNEPTKSTKFISSLSYKELCIVIKRLDLSRNKLDKCLSKIEKISITKSAKFDNYVFDLFDAHIVAGAVKSQSRFLISYNVRHFDVEKIKRDFNILVYSPGQFLQYLRSQ